MKRAELIALISLPFIVLTCIAAWLVVPAFEDVTRKVFGLEPSATPTPALEPVTVVIDWAEEVRRATVDAHRPVIAQWRWLVCQPQVVQEQLDTLTFEVTIDGRLTDTGNMAQHREEVREEDLYGRRWWVLYWSYPMGAFESGSFHWLEVEYHVIRSVTSGCDLDADGHLDMVEAGWQGVTRLELTVQ